MADDPQSTSRVREGLARAMARLGAGEVTALTRLSGGANMESWSFDWGGGGYVLRRAPSAQMMAGRALSLEQEARIIRAVRAAGVRAPQIVVELAPEDGLGAGFVMGRITGEVSPTAILADPPPSLLADIARELAAVHRTPPAALEGAPRMDTAEALAGLKARFAAYGGDRPILALAIRWLEDNLPAPAPPALVHGDLRMGNLIVAPEGLAAVLDWELAHIGDAHEDLAFGCMTVWRFGHIERPAFGLGSLEDFFAAYEAESGTTVDPVRFRFWLIYRTLWWALGCLQMGDHWRSRADRSLERVVIARRASENELDLLLLLEEAAPAAERERPLPPPAPAAPERIGEPDARELLAAVAEWLESDVKARSAGREKFLAAVAINALGIAGRELGGGARAEDADLARDLLGGRLGLASPGVLARLRRMAIDKLAADVPKYAALARARLLWNG
ncbi:MAG: phosphotransferase family protein [Caulobacteraceae bacterium]|nr:phosphotransferase family protein [Caulobacteraceae bacterium]